MADYAFSKLALHVRFVPDPVAAAGWGGADEQGNVAGTYEFGVELDGAFVPLFSEKSGRLDAAIAAAKANAEADKTAKPNASAE